MKQIKSSILVFILSIGLIFVQCSFKNPSDSNKPGLPRPLKKGEENIIKSSNKFGFKLFKEIVNQDKDKNIFISPLSVAMALGMTYNGARGTTKNAMQNTLEINDLTLKEFNESYKSLIELLMSLDSKVQFLIANSIWYRQNFNVEKEFIDLNKTFFNAEVTALDFNKPEAVNIINGWVNDKTNGKIKKIIDNIEPLVVMFLINAIYFKGTWTYEFDPEQTGDEYFYLLDGSKKQCKMMFQQGKLKYFENDDFQAVDLTYGIGDFSMTVILPRKEKNIDDIILRLNQENWNIWTNNFKESEGKLYLPKFKIKYELELRKVLTALGMEIAFQSGKADFSGINSNTDLYISKVLHKTYVDVNEEGTEAAAVTVVGISTSIGESLVIRIDRPFLFVIRENYSGTILFIGKIVEPVISD